MTPLQWAISNNQHDCVKLLIDHGASLSLGGRWDRRDFGEAISLAEMSGSNEEIKDTVLKAFNGMSKEL